MDTIEFSGLAAHNWNFGVPAKFEPVHTDSPLPLTNTRNIPGLLYSSQYQNTADQPELRGNYAIYDNAGACNWVIPSLYLVNGSLDVFANDLRENDNGLQKQTNPGYTPESNSGGAVLNPAGFTDFLNLPDVNRTDYSTTQEYNDRLFTSIT